LRELTSDSFFSFEKRISTVITKNKPVVTQLTTSSPSSKKREGSIFRRPWTSQEKFFADYAKEFDMWREQLPSWGAEIDAAVSEYIKGMEACVRGYTEWSLTCHRYFGSSVEEVKRTRRVALTARAS